MRYIFLSEEFYKTYNEEKYPEILHKPNRPYIMLLLEIESQTFAIPIRSHLRHTFGFITNEKTNAGLDFTKAVILLRSEYISDRKHITITKEEMAIISNSRELITRDFKNFVRIYKRKVKNKLPENLLKFCTLQYFHKELGLEQ